MRRKLTSRGCLPCVTLALGGIQFLMLCSFAILWLRSNQKPESLIVINYDDAFIAKRADEFDLPLVILQYEPVIIAIEKYYQDHGNYPSDLTILVPQYLPKIPGIYIANGERLTYKPEPLTEHAIVTSFTFHIYGHYSGLASMHGWLLYYCPIEFEGCNDPGDRHFRQFRVNDRWVWINRSAL